MPIRYQITKSTAIGESITVDIAQCHPVTGDAVHSKDELEQMVTKATVFVDARMLDMNMAMLEAYRFDSYFEPGVWLRVKQVMEVLAGRMQAQLLVNRWESAREETAELEKMRVEHAYQPGLHDSAPSNEAPISTVLPMVEVVKPTVTEKDVQAEIQYPSVSADSYPTAADSDDVSPFHFDEA